MKRDTLYLVSAPIREQFVFLLHYICRSKKIKRFISDTGFQMTAPSVSHNLLAHPELDRTKPAEPFLRTFRIVKINE